jgi:S1-C subfamily serine protease
MVKRALSKRLILSIFIATLILILSVSLISSTENTSKGISITGKSIIDKITPINNTEIQTLITGDIVFSKKPNELQKIYSKSLPSVAKINVYFSYDVFVPKLNSVSFDYNFNHYYPLYEDLNVKMDPNTNGFEYLFGDSLWESFYPGEYYGEDELGVYNYEMNEIDIANLKQEFYQYHNGTLPLLGGTGFIIDSRGYILTNAHVATLVDSEIELSSESIGYYYYIYYYHLLYNNANYNENVSLEEYEDYLQKTLFLEENLEIRNLKVSRIEVILGDGEDIKKYDAKLIDSNENYLDELGGRDWALLKIEGENFPSLPLGDSNNVPIGEDIVVIGYPWTSEGIPDTRNFYVSSTPTYGKVSNIVPSGKYKDIQIDISVEGGNSGGPALNLDGEVIGIATSGYNGLGGIYNYLTPINDVKSEIVIIPKQSQVDTLWNEGLENFWDENYAAAKSNFKEIESINPNHPYVQEIIKQLNEFPNTNTDTQDTNLKSPQEKEVSLISLIFIILGVAIVILLSFIAFNMFKRNNKRKKKKS